MIEKKVSMFYEIKQDFGIVDDSCMNNLYFGGN